MLIRKEIIQNQGKGYTMKKYAHIEKIIHKRMLTYEPTIDKEMIQLAKFYRDTEERLSALRGHYWLAWVQLNMKAFEIEGYVRKRAVRKNEI